MNREDLQQLSLTRLREAEILLVAGAYSGAYYLAGYSVECALKARIASFTQQYDFPDKRKTMEYYTHALKELIKSANLGAELAERQKLDATFASGWAAATNWNEESRYHTSSRKQAEELIAAVSDADHGVLTWLRLYW